jgi:hypothetical protein
MPFGFPSEKAFSFAGIPIQKAMKYVVVAGGDYEDQQDGQEAIRVALADLPVDSTDRQIEQVQQATLVVPIRERIAARLQLSTKEQLVQSGLRVVFWHASTMLREFKYENETASQIEERCKPEIERRLRKELTGDEEWRAGVTICSLSFGPAMILACSVCSEFFDRAGSHEGIWDSLGPIAGSPLDERLYRVVE